MSLFERSTAGVDLATTNRRRRLLTQRNQHTTAKVNFRGLLQPITLINFLGRLVFLALVVGVLVGVWAVSSAHLQEQLLGVQRSVAGLIDPDAGQGALTPDNIEKQVLAYKIGRAHV